MIETLPAAIPFVSLFDSLPDGVLWLEIVRDGESKSITDFRVSYGNSVAKTVLPARYQLAPGNWLLRDNAPHRAELLAWFTGFTTVINTGKPTDYFHFDGYRNRWLLMHSTTAGNGLLLTLRVVAAEEVNRARLPASPVVAEPAQPRVGLLETILATSLQGIVAYEAIRNEQGTIVDFRIQLVNEVARQQGVSLLSEPTVGLTLREFSPGSDQDGSFRLFVAVCESGEPFQGVHHYATLQQWANVAITKLNDGVLVTFNNVTEAKKAEIQAQEQAELLSTILDNSSSGIISCSVRQSADGMVADLIIQTANRAAEEFIGATNSQMIGASLPKIYPGQHDIGLLNLCAHAIGSHQTQREETCLKVGEEDRWLDVSVAPLNDGVVVTLTNSTEARQALLELEAQSVMLQDVVNGAINGILLLETIRDGGGQITDFCVRAANHATLAMTGADPATITNQPMLSVFSTYREAGFMNAFVQTIETGEPHRLEAYYPVDNNGLEGWFDVSAVKQDSEGVVLTFVNTTEAKKAELGRQALIAELQRSNANLEQFAYVASHDLQEPLRKVTAFGDVLQSQYAPMLGETGADVIQRMQSATGRMQVLIRDLLVYSRVVSKYDPLGSLNLNRLVAEVVTDLETVIQEKQAVLTVESLPELRGDALQWRQLMQNLLSNALKFTQSGVRPHIHICCHTVSGNDFPVVAPLQKRRPFYCIEVADNGIGFDPKYADRIFQVFQRLHGRSQYAGTGIGLAIVQKVVENHKGYIIAEGRPGVGATFKILLPVDNV